MDTAEAYRRCAAIARAHYENFPVASWLLPKRMRAPVAVVYAYARGADDIADEGPADPQLRLAGLDDWERRLDLAVTGQPPPDDAVFIALSDLLARHAVPVQPFRDLLTAFRLDVTTKRFSDFAGLLDYCRCSADPVGRILLHLHFSPCRDEALLQLSDRVCTSLQIINFLQDLAQDFDENGRIYLPLADLARFDVSEEQFARRQANDAMTELVRFQVARARDLMLEGAPLGERLTGRFGLEIRAIIAGGLRVLELLDAGAARPFDRPRLARLDGLRIFLRALGTPLKMQLKNR